MKERLCLCILIRQLVVIYQEEKEILGRMPQFKRTVRWFLVKEGVNIAPF